ncbi:gliding motility-associated C-terminal domain-containing protein [Algoriphagus sp.]|uniref:T9SS type B sorting domain-containing protein n=1 Tax=Algoriphagus sp. TaxID=1872435 RepID=UPI0027314E56|nr:gliding motility-associated C-terminal domain-containing protein [Algoriphagus sp.]MDP2042294.1 gliding motility-associated C-terminal domain-containing protein [Algoriphagus sp.]
MNAGKLISLYLLFVFLGLFQNLKAQNDYRVPFKHRIGSSNVPNNIFQIRGDFTIIGNTNLTLKNYSEEKENSVQEMVFVDIDQVPSTFNSSSATLLFSDENGADPNCTDILYAGLYWSGRIQTPGMTFELTKKEGFLDPVTLDKKKDAVEPGEELEYFPYIVYMGVMFDSGNKPFPQYEIVLKGGQNRVIIRFRNNNTIEYDINQSGWITVQDLKIEESNGMSTATFKPIPLSGNGMNFNLYGLTRSTSSDYNEFVNSSNSILLESSGTYNPAAYYTRDFDKRKLKFKPPGASEYQEITSSGNAILFPDQELKDIYVGYADVTSLVREYGDGEYTVADIALKEGFSDETGMLGNWGLIVIYQNSEMNFRDVTIFDGYTYIQALNGQAQNGELEIKGFGAIEEGPVSVKLGIMASEGDKGIGGDYLEILDQGENWTPLSHPGNSTDNFFNSSIYTPILMKNGDLVENQRLPNLKNNTGIDLAQWEIPNPDNSLIANNQSSVKFRYGTNQDLFALYVLAFSVSSYSPDIEALNTIESINGAPADDSSTVKPGEEITFLVDIRSAGTEATEQNKLVIPIPYNALFVSAEIIPSDFGTVKFDPDLGVAGSIVWEIGGIPIPESFNDIITSLRYTLKLTEDCFLLANDNCEPLLSVNGSISGIGSISNQRFSGIPFIKGYKEDACEGNAIYGPIEIPISGKAEFAAKNCPDFKLFTDLKLENIPVFCHRDSQTTDLADLITPSQEGFEVFFFANETGGTPLINYYVNTSLVGTEKVWVSEGPSGSCTGMRIPLELKVIPSSPQPKTENLNYCLEAKSSPYVLEPTPGYSLLYYNDNNPTTAPMSGPPIIDQSVPKRYSIWVSQIKEGECESARKEVSFYIEDCSLLPKIALSITSNIERYTQEGEEVIFTITVKNTGQIALFNVNVNESLQFGDWKIPELGPQEERSFEVRHVISALDLLKSQVVVFAQTSGNDWKGTLVSDNGNKDISGVIFEPGFLDYTLSTLVATCELEGTGKGQIIFSWPQEQRGMYILTHLETGEIEEVVTFFPRTQLIIEAPAGTYSLELLDWEGNSQKISSITIEGKEEVQFDVPSTIIACAEYIWIPETPNIIISLTAPDGNSVERGSDGSFTLVQTGTYSTKVRHENAEFCPTEKTFDAEIIQPKEFEIDMRPFCSDDNSTTVDLIEGSAGLSIRWLKIGTDGNEELDLFENSRQLIVAEEGSYQVTLSDPEGCLIGRTDFEVRQSFTDPPVLSSLYSYCYAKNDWVKIEVGERFKEFSWMLNGKEVSKEAVLIPNESGQYQLEAKDSFGCSFFSEFEVEEKCEPQLKFPNAILPNDPNKFFEIYPDNLADEVEIQIFNRWGQLIYHCKDKAPMNEIKSICVWDGIYNGAQVSNGSYAAIIQVKNHRLNVTRRIRTSIMVLY